MNSPSIDVFECESISVRCSDGEIFEFPVVENKDLFRNYFRTDGKFNWQLQCFEEYDSYAIYKRHKNIAYLVCVWNKKEEINEEAMNIIKGDVRLHRLLNEDYSDEQ